MDSRRPLQTWHTRLGNWREKFKDIRAPLVNCEPMAVILLRHRWMVYPMFVPDGDQIVRKTYMTRVEGENTRLRHYLARLHRKTLCYSKSLEMLKHSLQLLIHYLKFWDVPVPARSLLAHQR